MFRQSNGNDGANGYVRLDADQAQEPVDVALKDHREALPCQHRREKIHTHKSVLERFQEYTGERTEKALTSLSEQDGAIGFRQEPQSSSRTEKRAEGRIYYGSGTEKRFRCGGHGSEPDFLKKIRITPIPGSRS
jgi:hypothetical protein